MASPTPAPKGAIPKRHHSTKLFEYLAAARPILAIGGARGVITETLETGDAGLHAICKGASAGISAHRVCQLQDKTLLPRSGQRRAVEERHFAGYCLVDAAKSRRPSLTTQGSRDNPVGRGSIRRRRHTGFGPPIDPGAAQIDRETS
jgi:hypothetical protein